MDDYIKKNIYYLTILELESLVDYFGGDYFYYYYVINNKKVRIGADRKERIIRNIFRYLEGKKPKLTIIPEKVIKFEPIKSLSPNTKVYYGQYINGNKEILNLMRELTDNKFKFGVAAQRVLMHHWLKGELITYKQLAKEWLEYKREENPEWQYIDYVRRTGSKEGWAEEREKIAKRIIKNLKKIHLDNILSEI